MDGGSESEPAVEKLFCVTYRFRVKPGREDDFRRAWLVVTEGFMHHCGSFGSRLHRSDDGNWFAYAQWPDRETWERAQLPPALDRARARMRACCLSMDTLWELQVVEDRLLPPGD